VGLMGRAWPSKDSSKVSRKIETSYTKQRSFESILLLLSLSALSLSLSHTHTQRHTDTHRNQSSDCGGGPIPTKAKSDPCDPHLYPLESHRPNFFSDAKPSTTNFHARFCGNEIICAFALIFLIFTKNYSTWIYCCGSCC